MKEYYYLIGKEQKGPFSLDELKLEKITNETLIWFEGLDNWKKIKELSDLQNQLQVKTIPPPPPIVADEIIPKTEVIGQLKVTTEKKPNSALQVIKPSKKVLTWLIIWCSFHLFALLMSYSRIDFFNDKGNPRTDKFWPAVEFFDYKRPYGGVTISNGSTWKYKYEKEHFFNGVFVNYDYTEFAFYAGGALVLFIIVRLSENKNTDEEHV